MIPALSLVMASLGLTLLVVGVGAVGWVLRGQRIERDVLDRCLDCDALKKRGGLVVVHGKRPGRAVEAREKGLLT